MPRHDRAELLRTLPPALRLATIEATLPVAARAERTMLEEELLELLASDGPRRKTARDVISPLLTAARCWSCLSRHARERLGRVHRRSWAVPIRAAAVDPRTSSRADAARVIADLRAYELADVLISLIADQDAEVARVADLSLLRLASDLAGASLGSADRPTRVTIDPDIRWRFERVIADGVRAAATHRRRGVILAAVLLLDDAAAARARAQGRAASPLLGALADGVESSQMMLRAVVRRSKEPMVRERALTWLASGPATAAAVDRLSVAYSKADHEAVLCRSHLLARPARARRAAMIRLHTRSTRDIEHDPDAPLDESVTWPARAPAPPPQAVMDLSAEARAGLPRWCSAIRMTVSEKSLALTELIADEDPATRHAMLRAAPRRLVGELSFDADERVARSAITHWSLAGEHGAPSRPEDARLVQRLQRSPHATVRRIASEEAARFDLWNPRSAASRLAAHRALESRRKEFIAELRNRAVGRDARQRIDAMLLAASIGVADQLEVELLRAATGSLDGLEQEDMRWHIAATAVAVLADVSTPSARQAVTACLAHRADRVRANAVEAAAVVTRRTAPATLADKIVELKRDPCHRVRANVLHELLRGDGSPESLVNPAAAQGVADMLSDQRPMHRIAGLWVTERLLPTRRNTSLAKRWAELSVRVAEMAKSDDDARVRHRGGRCARRLLAQMRTGWRTRATALKVDHDVTERVEEAARVGATARGAA